jgi:protein SCO1
MNARHSMIAALFVLVLVCVAQGQMTTKDIMDGVKIDQRLNEQLPLSLSFRDESGQQVHLEQYFSTQPVILVLAQYRCPMLCTQVLNGLVKSMQSLPFDAGQQYRVLTVSFDARETPEMAGEKRASYLKEYGRDGAADGWHFLTGDQEAIDALTAALGFHYVYDAPHDQFAHASGIFVLTPRGQIARYFFGIEYPARDLRLALVEASQGKIGTPADWLLLLCYHYDPATGRYTPSVMALLRIAAMLTVVVVALLVFGLWIYERHPTRSKDAISVH